MRSEAASAASNVTTGETAAIAVVFIIVVIALIAALILWRRSKRVPVLKPHDFNELLLLYKTFKMKMGLLSCAQSKNSKSSAVAISGLSARQPYLRSKDSPGTLWRSKYCMMLLAPTFKRCYKKQRSWHNLNMTE